MLSPELRTAGPAELAAGVDKLDRGIFAPADAVGEAVVRAIGRVGPVVIPYWWVWVLGQLVGLALGSAETCGLLRRATTP